MDAVEFLASNVVALPKERIVDDFVEYAEGLLSDYRDLMSKVTKSSLINAVITARIDCVVEVSAGLLECLKQYFRGHPTLAYQSLDKVLAKLGPHFALLCPTGDMSSVVNPMYRFRTAGLNPFQPRDLFHIPFQLRHIVASQRYSIPGLPALYLGGSTYDCWLELGKPDLAQIEVSRFEAILGTNLRVLNFGRRPELLAAWILAEPEEFKELSSGSAVVGSFVACWPLIALCSIRKKHATASFHAEYILPQLVLQWITNTREFHGIRYFSTHYDAYHDDPKTYMNYVFPARTVNSTGLCPELCGLFRLSNPMRWPVAKAGVPSLANRPRYKHRGELLSDFENEFGHVESVLLGNPVVTLT